MQELFCAVNSVGESEAFHCFPSMNTTALQALYHELNLTYFEGILPPCRILLEPPTHTHGRQHRRALRHHQT
jgi:hypothetical protein